jgi:hypothetical protein
MKDIFKLDSEMENASPPKKPMTAFFIFRQKLAEKGEKMSSKIAGERWQNLKESEKKKFEDEYKEKKAAYDKYLEEVEGIAPKSSSKKTEKPTCYNPSRIRAVCGKNKDIKEMSTQVTRALGRVVEKFMQDVGRSCFDEMKKSEVKTCTYDILVSAVGQNKSCAFLKEMPGYDKAIKDAEDATEAEKVKRAETREKNKEKKAKEKDEESEDETKTKKKKGKKKEKC